MKSLVYDDNAVSVTVGYILYSAISIAFFLLVLFNANEILVEKPSNVVMEDGFSDVGNMICTLVTDMYLIAPENGHIETSYLLPAEIAGETYTINAEAASIDQSIEVVSAISERCVSVTISGIARTIPINGTAISSTSTHVISYDSRRSE